MIVKNLKAIEQYTFLDLIQKYTIMSCLYYMYSYIHREGRLPFSMYTQTSVQEDPDNSP